MVPSAIRHVRPVRPVAFPETDPEWDMGETTRHRRLRECMADSLLVATPREEAAVGSDQFLYFDPRDGRRRCAPDAFLKLAVAQTPFDTWKTWEGGAPNLCIEIVSPSDKEKQTLEEKLERFHEMGVAEVIAYDPDAPRGRRLRAWDLVSGDLVERVVEAERTPCVTLGLWFVLAPTVFPELTADALRLAEDPAGTRIVPTPTERERAEKERERAEKERERAEKERERAEKERERAEKERERAEKEAALAEIARLRAKPAVRPHARRPSRKRRA